MSNRYQPYRVGTPGRLDVAGVEWWACDPYPTWYRYEGTTLIRRDELRGSPMWADTEDQEKKDALYLKLLGARERLCSAQMLVPQEHKDEIEQAINRIDRCGAEVVPEVWSRFDRTHEGY